VPYAGNILFEPIPNVLNYWSGFNHCDSPPTINSIPDTDPTDGCTAEHQLYPNGLNGVTVEHYKIINGLHTWPGSAFGGSGTNQDIDACKEIWRFFSKYDIHGLINTTDVAEPKGLPSARIYPNPTHSQITIEMSTPGPTHFILTTLLGQPILSGTFSASKHQLDISSVPAGMYVLNAGPETFKILVTE
jgi:polyhydroxybutyrate depolymerase